MAKGTLHMVKNAKYNSKVYSSGSCHKLTNNMNNIDNVRRGHSQIDEIVNKLPIQDDIFERNTIERSQTNIWI